MKKLSKEDTNILSVQLLVKQGTQFQCPACGEFFKEFDNFAGPDGICPFCGCQDDNLWNFIYEGDDLNL